MQIERADFLKRLLAVAPAVTPTETIQQSTCVVFRKGRLYTLNRELACSIVSNLDEDLEGAVPARMLIDLLKKMTEEHIQVSLKDGYLVIAGKNRMLRQAVQADIVLPIGMVELPKKDSWTPLHPEFSAAIDLVSRCTVKKATEFGRMCVHLHPKWIEASDNHRMSRWTIPTFVPSSALVRGSTIQAVAPLGMTKGAETRNWLHFKNSFGLRASVRKWPVDHYPDHAPFLEIRGQKMSFPKVLAEAAERAGLVLDDVQGSIKVSISRNKIEFFGIGSGADYTEERVIEYTGQSITFLIPPKLIAELCEQQTSCEVSRQCLRVANENYIYLSSLELQDVEPD